MSAEIVGQPDERPQEPLSIRVVLFGPKGAGKGYISDILMREYGFDVFSISQEVRDDPLVQQTDPARGREGIREAAKVARLQDAAVFARRADEHATASQEPDAVMEVRVLEGHLTQAEAQLLEARGYTLVYVTAPENLREMRTASRTDIQETHEQWIEQDLNEREGLPDGLGAADDLVARTHDVEAIHNDGTEEALRAQLLTAMGHAFLRAAHFDSMAAVEAALPPA